MSYDKKMLRVWTILNKLNTEKKVITEDLAREFNVSVRTVQRDIGLINVAGFLLVSNERGHYSFMEGFSLGKVALSEEEASLLSVLYEIARSLGSNFETSFRDIFRKILDGDKDLFYYVKMPEGEKLNKEYPFMDQIKDAIENYRKLELYYVAEKKKKHKVDPLKIILFGGFWYLLARIDGKEWIVKFRLDKIKKMKILDEEFEEPENLRLLLDESLNIWFSDERDKKIVIKVDECVSDYFRKQKFFPMQKIKKKNKDGSLLLESKVGDFMEVIPNILKWIPHVTVVEPADLKKEIKTRIRRYLQKV